MGRPSRWGASQKTCEAVLYDLAGRQITTYNLSEGHNVVNIQTLKSGIYMLRTDGSVSKIVKQ